jgi:hypothetical protein
MRETTLPSPGVATTIGFELRRKAAMAISQAEVVARRTTGGKTRAASQLSTFFTACASALTSIADITVPTVSTRVRTNATTATITFSEPLDQTVVPALSTITIGARVLSAVTVNGSGQLVVTGTAITAGDVITYTKPATNYLRDPAGNALATFTGALA